MTSYPSRRHERFAGDNALSRSRERSSSVGSAIDQSDDKSDERRGYGAPSESENDVTTSANDGDWNRSRYDRHAGSRKYVQRTKEFFVYLESDHLCSHTFISLLTFHERRSNVSNSFS